MTLIDPEIPNVKETEPDIKQGKGGGSNCHVKRMLPRHFKILELKLAGIPNTEIAEVVGCTAQMVGIVTRSPIFRAEMNRRLKDDNQQGAIDEAEAFASKARMTLEQNAEKAADTQADLLDSEDDSVRLRASGSILDRVLGKAEGTNASEFSQPKIEINAKDAKLIVVALKESRDLKEIQNGEADSAADGSTAGPSEDGQGDVHQTPLLGPGK